MGNLRRSDVPGKFYYMYWAPKPHEKKSCLPPEVIEVVKRVDPGDVQGASRWYPRRQLGPRTCLIYDHDDRRLTFIFARSSKVRYLDSNIIA